MTTKTQYCTADEVRRLLGLTSSDISDSDVQAFITLAEEEVDRITNTTYLVTQDSGTATAGGTNTLTDGSKTWTTDEWASDDNLVGGYMVYIYAGTGSGQCRVITSNTSTQLTVSPDWTTNPSTDSKYRIFKNTYKDETFDGDGTETYYTQYYPLLNVLSLTIDSTSITLGGTYTYIYYSEGMLKLGEDAEKTTFQDDKPQLCNVKYFYGIYPIPEIIKKLTAVVAGLMVGSYMIGKTYTFATSYSIPEMSITKGVPYPHFEKVVNELAKQRDYLVERIKSIINPAIG
jgi:hypothetical protein